LKKSKHGECRPKDFCASKIFPAAAGKRSRNRNGMMGFALEAARRRVLFIEALKTKGKGKTSIDQH